MKEITLTRGRVALVDDEDYDYLNQWKWYCLKTQKLQYAYIRSVNGKKNTVYMHRQILNPPKGFVTDHIDGDGLNNQKSNLRLCSHAENMRNRRSFGTSRYLGVSIKKTLKNGDQCFAAQITVNRKTIYLGYFKNEKMAALAYNKAAIKYNGEFARLNDIPLD